MHADIVTMPLEQELLSFVIPFYDARSKATLQNSEILSIKNKTRKLFFAAQKTARQIFDVDSFFILGVELGAFTEAHSR